MIYTSDPKQEKQPVRAVGLLSGGLDSTIACRVVKELGVEVYGVYFAMPWGCCNKGAAQAAADKVGIKFIVLQLDERYLEMVKNPKHGYGTALNPCVDCRIHMFSRAAKYMEAIGADFVFTGEVLGQRPMSQMRKSMRWIEEGSGLEGRLLRPLCARHLPPTIPEEEGKIDRGRLLDISGRSRKDQIRLAGDFGITDYPNPAGGCLLTDHHFARRMKDTLDHGYRNFRETVALQWGRHFRLDKDFKIILGRTKDENEALKAYAHQDDLVMEIVDKKGPTLILKGPFPDGKVLAVAAGLIQRYSPRRDEGPITAEYWPAREKKPVQQIQARVLSEKYIESIKI